MACIAASMMEWQTPSAQAGGRLADAPATRSDFAACVDRCVRALIAAPRSQIVDGALAQLRRWLCDDAIRLADGTPVDLALFDETILSVDERIAPAGAGTQAQLLRASRQLAESIYVKT